MTHPDLALYRVPGIPLIAPGTDLATVLGDALAAVGLAPRDGDILAVAQKIVSKAESRIVALASIDPSPAAERLAGETLKDPRLVELVLRESRRVVRTRPGVIIVEHRLGIVMANAGIDRSNVSGSEDSVLLLPEDPDASARRLQAAFRQRFGTAPGVLITDSVGRPWRLGTHGLAIGCAGVAVLEDLRGEPDLFGRALQVSEVATADALAAAACVLMGEGAEGSPAVLIRGMPVPALEQTARDALRDPAEDLFR